VPSGLGETVLEGFRSTTPGLKPAYQLVLLLTKIAHTAAPTKDHKINVFLLSTKHAGQSAGTAIGAWKRSRFCHHAATLGFFRKTLIERARINSGYWTNVLQIDSVAAKL